MATEKFSNVGQSTLNGGITAIATTLVITSATPFPTTGQFRILIDNELILVTVVAGTTWTIARGIENTTAAIHANSAVVTHLLTAGGNANNPRAMTTTGDIEYLNSSGAVTRLAIGADGTLLVASGGVPIWFAGVPGTAILNVENHFTARQHLDTPFPWLQFNETDQALDLKKWRILVENHLFFISTLNDSESIAVNILQLDRSGNLSVNGNLYMLGTRSTIQYSGDGGSAGRIGLHTPSNGNRTYLVGYNAVQVPIADPWELSVGSGGEFLTQRSRLNLWGDLDMHPLAVDPETTSLPSNGDCRIYFKNNAIIFAFNDGGTVRYKFLSLVGTGVTWQHQTIVP